MRLLSGALLGLVIVSAANAQPTHQSQTNGRVTIHCGPVRGVILKRVTPKYPPEARAKGIQGLVRISAQVGKDGVPQKLQVLSGPPELVNSSLDAVKQWRYKPYKLNGEPVAVEATVDIHYVIPPKKPATKTGNH